MAIEFTKAEDAQLMKDCQAIGNAPPEPLDREVRQADVYAKASAAIAQGKLPAAQQVPAGPEPEAPITVHVDDHIGPTNSWDLPDEPS